MDSNWYDSSVEENHGAVSAGTPSFDSNSKVGRDAGYFADSQFDLVSIPDDNSLDIADNLSSSFWIKINSEPDDYAETPIAKAGTTANANYAVYVFGTGSGLERRIIFYANRGGTFSTVSSTSASTELELGVWHHIGFNYQSSIGGQIYINGEAVGSRAGSGVLATNPDPLRLFSNFSSSASTEAWIDDLSIWDVNLSDNDFKTIYNRQKQKYAGHYDSPVMDIGDIGSWTNLDVITNLPYLKELPGSSGSELSANYSDLVGSIGATTDNNLMSGLVALWHMNESSWDGTVNEVVDSSGNGKHGIAVNSAIINNNGLMNRSGDFNGGTSYVNLGTGVTPLGAKTISS